jgi:hypothetical protein
MTGCQYNSVQTHRRADFPRDSFAVSLFSEPSTFEGTSRIEAGLGFGTGCRPDPVSGGLVLWPEFLGVSGVFLLLFGRFLARGRAPRTPGSGPGVSTSARIRRIRGADPPEGMVHGGLPGASLGQPGAWREWRAGSGAMH